MKLSTSTSSLIAAAALLIDYVLTAAVSLTAGVEAIASAFPSLWPYRVELALVLLVVITLLNLRGIQETGTMIAIPVYLFLVAFGEVVRQKAAAGVKQMLVYPIAFVSDHIETLYELGMQYADLARESGIAHYRVVPALNAHPLLIRALADLVRNAGSPP